MSLSESKTWIPSEEIYKIAMNLVDLSITIWQHENPNDDTLIPLFPEIRDNFLKNYFIERNKTNVKNNIEKHGYDQGEEFILKRVKSIKTVNPH